MFRPRPFRGVDANFGQSWATLNSLTIWLLVLSAPVDEQLGDDTPSDWSPRRKLGKTEPLLIVPNAPRVQFGVPEVGCAEAGPQVKVARRVGGVLSVCGWAT